MDAVYLPKPSQSTLQVLSRPFSVRARRCPQAHAHPPRYHTHLLIALASGGREPMPQQCKLRGCERDAHGINTAPTARAGRTRWTHERRTHVKVEGAASSLIWVGAMSVRENRGWYGKEKGGSGRSRLHFRRRAPSSASSMYFLFLIQTQNPGN